MIFLFVLFVFSAGVAPSARGAVADPIFCKQIGGIIDREKARMENLQRDILALEQRAGIRVWQFFEGKSRFDEVELAVEELTQAEDNTRVSTLIRQQKSEISQIYAQLRVLREERETHCASSTGIQVTPVTELSCAEVKEQYLPFFNRVDRLRRQLSKSEETLEREEAEKEVADKWLRVVTPFKELFHVANNAAGIGLIGHLITKKEFFTRRHAVMIKAYLRRWEIVKNHWKSAAHVAEFGYKVALPLSLMVLASGGVYMFWDGREAHLELDIYRKSLAKKLIVKELNVQKETLQTLLGEKFDDCVEYL